MQPSRLILCALVAALLAGCSAALPRDPEGTLDRVTGGVIRIGVSSNPPHTAVTDDGTADGTEAEIMETYADSINAQIEWVPGAESTLMERLDLGEVDVVIGGLTSDTPWSSHAAITRPYAEAIGPDGKTTKLVIATRVGENALLTSLERFLIDEGLDP